MPGYPSRARQQQTDALYREHMEMVEQVLTEMVRLLRTINARLVLASLKENEIMLDLTGLEQSVSRVNTVADSAVTLIKEIAAQLAANAGDQPAIEAIAAELNSHAEVLSAAIVANTPAAEPPPVEPPAEPPADSSGTGDATANDATVNTEGGTP